MSQNPDLGAETFEQWIPSPLQRVHIRTAALALEIGQDCFTRLRVRRAYRQQEHRAARAAVALQARQIRRHQLPWPVRPPGGYVTRVNIEAELQAAAR